MKILQIVVHTYDWWEFRSLSRPPVPGCLHVWTRLVPAVFVFPPTPVTSGPMRLVPRGNGTHWRQSHSDGSHEDWDWHPLGTSPPLGPNGMGPSPSRTERRLETGETTARSQPSVRVPQSSLPLSVLGPGLGLDRLEASWRQERDGRFLGFTPPSPLPTTGTWHLSFALVPSGGRRELRFHRSH